MAEATEKPRLILWGAGTPRTMRAQWILQELELEYERRPIGPRTGETQQLEYVRLNPREKVPLLQDGDLTVAESAAIVTYLGETYGGSKGLVPPLGTPERAAYYEWCFFCMTELDATTLYVVRRHVGLKEIYGEAPNAVRAAFEGFEKQIRVAHLKLADGRPFILGDTFTGADLLLTTCIVSGHNHKLKLSDLVLGYMNRNTSRGAYQRALAANRRP